MKKGHREHVYDIHISVVPVHQTDFLLLSHPALASLMMP